MKIKLTPQKARLLLNTQSCEIYVPKASSSFVSSPGIRDNRVHVPKEGIFIPLEDIASISFEDRFGNRASMEVEW